MTSRKLSPFTWSLLAIAAILIIGFPWANRYMPYTNTFGHFVDAWQVDPKDDPHYQYRYSIVLFGFSLTGLSLLPLIASFINRKENFGSRLLNVLIFLLIFSIGFKNYPYWANGLLYVYSTGSQSTAYDPKAILPMNEFGEQWGDAVFCFYLVSFVLILYFLFRLIVKFFYGDEPNEIKYHRLTLPVVVLLALSFFTTPNFFGWLAD